MYFIFTESSILDVWLGSEYTYEVVPYISRNSLKNTFGGDFF